MNRKRRIANQRARNIKSKKGSFQNPKGVFLPFNNEGEIYLRYRPTSELDPAYGHDQSLKAKGIRNSGSLNYGEIVSDHVKKDGLLLVYRNDVIVEPKEAEVLESNFQNLDNLSGNDFNPGSNVLLWSILSSVASANSNYTMALPAKTLGHHKNMNKNKIHILKKTTK